MKRIMLVLLLAASASVVALADVPKPAPSTKQNAAVDSTLRINLKSDAKDARLIIPKDLLRQLQAGLEQPGIGNDNLAAFTGTGVTRLQTIVGGLFLSFAIVFGGIWLARSGKVGSKPTAAAVLFVVLALGSAATFVYANYGPPAEARKVTGKMFSDYVHQYKFGSGPIKVELAEGDGDVLLIVPDQKDAPKSGE